MNIDDRFRGIGDPCLSFRSHQVGQGQSADTHRPQAEEIASRNAVAVMLLRIAVKGQHAITLSSGRITGWNSAPREGLRDPAPNHVPLYHYSADLINIS